MGVGEPRCPIQAFHPQGERRGPAFLDFRLAVSGTLARVSEESGLVDPSDPCMAGMPRVSYVSAVCGTPGQRVRGLAVVVSIRPIPAVGTGWDIRYAAARRRWEAVTAGVSSHRCELDRTPGLRRGQRRCWCCAVCGVAAAAAAAGMGRTVWSRSSGRAMRNDGERVALRWWRGAAWPCSPSQSQPSSAATSWIMRPRRPT